MLISKRPSLQILDSDMILVMSGGRVAEYAPPQELLKDEVRWEYW